MHSRAILFAGSLALGCLILLGTGALYVVLEDGVAVARADVRPVPSDTAEPNRDAVPSSAGRSEAIPEFRTPASDALEALLERVLRPLEPGMLAVSDSTIPLFARMIQLLDGEIRDDVHIEVSDPRQDVARGQAELLRNALLLNVQQPSRLRIDPVEGPASVRVRLLRKNHPSTSPQ